MNKETKVGLLVGLSFIVLFGVILSKQAPDIVAPPEKPMIVPTSPRATQVQVIRQIEPAWPAPEPIDLVVDAAGEQTDVSEVAPVALAPTAEAAIADASTANQPLDATVLTASSGADATRTITADDLGPQMADAEPGDAEMELVSSKVAPDGTRTTVYIVKGGDSLAKIARQFYGDASSRNIDRLYNANKDKMPNKRTLRIGTQIEVPVEGVVKKDPAADALLASGHFDAVPERKPADKPKDAPAVKDVPIVGAKSRTSGQTPARTAVAEVSDEALEDILRKRTASQPPVAANTSNELARVVVPVSVEEKAAARKNDPQQATKELEKTALVSRENVRHYQIRKGDTWYKLAAKFMGDSKRWPELYALNDDILPDATKLRTGVKVRIPVGKGLQDSVE